VIILLLITEHLAITSLGSISILKRDLTPQPPDLQGPGEKGVNFPRTLQGRGAGGRGQIGF